MRAISTNKIQHVIKDMRITTMVIIITIMIIILKIVVMVIITILIRIIIMQQHPTPLTSPRPGQASQGVGVGKLGPLLPGSHLRLPFHAGAGARSAPHPPEAL